MARKLYPIGIQTFEEIRKNDNLYVDKTEYISLTSMMHLCWMWLMMRIALSCSVIR